MVKQIFINPENCSLIIEGLSREDALRHLVLASLELARLLGTELCEDAVLRSFGFVCKGGCCRED